MTLERRKQTYHQSVQSLFEPSQVSSARPEGLQVVVEDVCKSGPLSSVRSCVTSPSLSAGPSSFAALTFAASSHHLQTQGHSMASAIMSECSASQSEERLQKSCASVLRRSCTVIDAAKEFANSQPAVIAAAATACMHVANASNSVENPRLRLDWLRWVVESGVFAFSVFSLIFANAVLIAVSSDLLIRDAVAEWDAKNGQSTTTLSLAWLKAADTVFTAVFFVELCLRLLALEGGVLHQSGQDGECRLLGVSVRLRRRQRRPSVVKPTLLSEDAEGTSSGAIRSHHTQVTHHALHVQAPLLGCGVHQLIFGALLGSRGADPDDLHLFRCVCQQFCFPC